MKAIVLAAGEGTRLKPITNDIPKALVQVGGKSLLEHNLDTLFQYVDEIIIIVKYKAEAVKKHIWDTYKWVKVTYYTQGNIKGTGAAIKGFQRKGDILILYSDAIVHKKDVQKVIKHKGYAVLAHKVKNPEKYGIFQTDKKWRLLQVIEKPKEYIGNLANFSYFKVNENIFDMVEKIWLSPRGELEITDAINLFAKKHTMKVLKLKHPLYDITKPEDIDTAQKKIKKENKNYTIKRLEKKDILKHFDSFVETLENLKPTGDTNKKRIKKFFDMALKQWPIYGAVKKDGEIIGTVKVLLEAKLIRGWQFAAKIEDFSVRKWFEGLWIGSKLIKKALHFCEKKEAYKVTLSCREDLLWFYEKFGFVRYSTNMKLYMKK